MNGFEINCEQLKFNLILAEILENAGLDGIETLSEIYQRVKRS
jgi:hypothetical protein